MSVAAATARARPWLWGASSCLGLCLLSVAAVDRPAARLAHATFAGHDLAFRALTHIVDPLPPLAALGLLAAAAASALGWRPGPNARVAIACALAVAVSLMFREQLKFAFGRLWPETWVQDNPSFIRDGAYGFHPFHGGTGWTSFPSGHMALVTAPVGALWAARPRWRPLLSVPVLLVAAGLYGADFHFVADLVAGTYLGGACGVGCLALLRGAGPAAGIPAP